MAPLSPQFHRILNETRDNVQICRRSNNGALEGPCRQEDTDEQARGPVYDDLGMLIQHRRAFAFEPAPLLDLFPSILSPFPSSPGSLSEQKPNNFSQNCSPWGVFPRDYQLIFLGL